MSVSHDEDRYNETHIRFFILHLAGHFTQHENMKRGIADRAIACLIDNPPLETDALERELFSLVVRIARDELELRSKDRALRHESLRSDQPALEATADLLASRLSHVLPESDLYPCGNVQ